MAIDILLLGLLVVLLLAVLVLIVIVVRGRQSTTSHDLSKELSSNVRDLSQRFDSFRNTIDGRLDKNNKVVYEQFAKQSERSEKLIENITRELTEVKSTGQQMLSFTDQLESLERTLKNPQRRGALGEYVLEQVIANVLPPGAYATQYTFKSGVRADAVVFLQDEKIICIDAKFSLDTYTKIVETTEEDTSKLETRLRSDIKDRIEETSKYILPQEGTLDYAFMFIPSEALYYDLLSQKIGGTEGKNILEYAFSEKKVIIISPTTLLAYLQTVMLGLRSLQIEKHAQDIIKNANVLQRHLQKYNGLMQKIGKGLQVTVNHYNSAHSEYLKIDKDFLKITGVEGDISTEKLSAPDDVDREEQ